MPVILLARVNVVIVLPEPDSVKFPMLLDVSSVIVFAAAASVNVEVLIVPGGGPAAKLGRGSVPVRGNGLVAMAFLVMGLAAGEAITIDDDRVIPGIYPEFRTGMQALGADFFKRWTK